MTGRSDWWARYADAVLGNKPLPPVELEPEDADLAAFYNEVLPGSAVVKESPDAPE